MDGIQYTPTAAYDKSLFTAPLPSGQKVTHDVYTRGEGPPVILIQELPGVTPALLRLADFLVKEDYTVYLPHLFGPLEKSRTVGNTLRLFCLYKEFHLFSAGKSSPIVDWLRALCRETRENEQVDGVGVIGLCLTGNFALTLMGDESVLAAVASQPSLPFFPRKALHMSPEEIDATKRNIDRTAPMMAYRFKYDWISPCRRFTRIGETFNEPGNERIRMEELPGRKHAVLTAHFCDEAGHPTRNALDAVLDYLSNQLK